MNKYAMKYNVNAIFYRAASIVKHKVKSLLMDAVGGLTDCLVLVE